MGEAKRRRKATVLPFRPGLDGNATDRVCLGDREWFDAHPTRKRRLRPMIAGECPVLVPGRYHYCIVTKVGPGVRTRQFVHFCAPVDRELSEHEVGKLSPWVFDPTKPFPFAPDGTLKS